VRKKLVAPVAAVLVGGVVLAGFFHATLTRLPEVEAEETPAPRCLLDLEAIVWKSRIKVGEPLPVEFRLRNQGNSPVWVLPPLHKSERGRRYPKCGLEIRDASGILQGEPQVSGLSVEALKAADFQRLEPGRCSDPLDHSLLRWKPERPGIYTLQFTYDSSPRGVREWEPFDRSLSPETLLRLAGMPRGLYTARAIIEVTD